MWSLITTKIKTETKKRMKAFLKKESKKIGVKVNAYEFINEAIEDKLKKV